MNYQSVLELPRYLTIRNQTFLLGILGAGMGSQA